MDFDDAGDAVHLPHAAVFVFKLGLLVARMAVALALGFVVPTLLVLLAIVFGPGLHRAARTVRAAGRRADDALARASSVVRSEHAPRRRRRKAKHWRRRVATQGAEDGGRIRRQRVVDDGAVDAPRWSEADDEDRAEEAGAPDTDAGIDRDAARKRPRR